jgi:hypothetical protein
MQVKPTCGEPLELRAAVSYVEQAPDRIQMESWYVDKGLERSDREYRGAAFKVNSDTSKLVIC